MDINKSKKLEELRKKLNEYQEKLSHEMKGYRGVIHESAASEIKHDRVMVVKAMVESLQDEISKLEKDTA